MLWGVDPIFVFATSGACSYHGGVNCGVSQNYGSLVCNDSWTNSSVNYYNIEECKTSISKCTSPYHPICDVSDLTNQCNQTRAQASRSGLAGSDFGNEQINECHQKITDCEDQQNKYLVAQNEYIQCLSKPVEKTEIPQQIINIQPIDEIKVDSCWLKYRYAYTENNHCVCQKGYIFVDDNCVQDCSVLFGPNMETRDSNSCACKTGYEFNSQESTCEKMVEIIPITTEIFLNSDIEKLTITKKSVVPKRQPALNNLLSKKIMPLSITTIQKEFYKSPNNSVVVSYKIEQKSNFFDKIITFLKSFYK